MEQINREPLIFEHLKTQVPFKQQIDFFCADCANIAYGGARGGGKSWAMRRKMVMLAMRYPDLKLLLLRRTYTELYNNHILPLQLELHGYAKYKDSEKSFVFPNGSRLILGYCDNDGDVSRYQGQECDVIGFEEATNFKEAWITLIKTSLRTTRSDFKPRVYYTCNPGGIGHSYIKRLFIDKQYIAEKGERAEDFVFIPAKLSDNKILMENNPEYVRQLEALPPKLRKAHLDGCWDIYDGQVFDEFRDLPENYPTRLFTHVIEPFNIPESFNIYRSFDWGYSKPFSCNWYAIDHDGRMYMILEYYGCTGEPNVGIRMTPDEVFKEISRIEKEHPWLKGKSIRGVADPAIWNAETGISVEDAARSHGIYFEKGDNSRISGWLQIHERLKFDERGVPMLYIFNTCRHTIRTFPLMQYSTRNPEDIDSDLEDHALDSLRYMCNMRPIKPDITTNNTAKPYNPLDDDVQSFGSYDFYKII